MVKLTKEQKNKIKLENKAAKLSESEVNKLLAKREVAQATKLLEPKHKAEEVPEFERAYALSKPEKQFEEKVKKFQATTDHVRYMSGLIHYDYSKREIKNLKKLSVKEAKKRESDLARGRSGTKFFDSQNGHGKHYVPEIKFKKREPKQKKPSLLERRRNNKLQKELVNADQSKNIKNEQTPAFFRPKNDPSRPKIKLSGDNGDKARSSHEKNIPDWFKNQGHSAVWVRDGEKFGESKKDLKQKQKEAAQAAKAPAAFFSDRKDSVWVDKSTDFAALERKRFKNQLKNAKQEDKKMASFFTDSAKSHVWVEKGARFGETKKEVLKRAKEESKRQAAFFTASSNGPAWIKPGSDFAKARKAKQEPERKTAYFDNNKVANGNVWVKKGTKFRKTIKKSIKQRDPKYLESAGSVKVFRFLGKLKPRFGRVNSKKVNKDDLPNYFKKK